jgi:hypothetical protein
MLTDVAPDWVEETLTEAVTTRSLSIEVSEECVLSNILMDQGDGARPFHPLLGTIDGSTMDLPMSLSAGTHVVYLTGEQFSGVKVLLVGHGLYAVKRIAAGDSIGASTSGYYEGAGAPSDTFGKNGDRYYDTDDDMMYEKANDSWRQR